MIGPEFLCGDKVSRIATRLADPWQLLAFQKALLIDSFSWIARITNCCKCFLRQPWCLFGHQLRHVQKEKVSSFSTVEQEPRVVANIVCTFQIHFLFTGYTGTACCVYLAFQLYRAVAFEKEKLYRAIS